MDLKQQTVDVYNQQAKAMEEKFARIGARTKDIDYALSLVQKEHPFVLEIGCGDGRDAAEFVKRTDHYLGVDVSEGMIELARKKVPNATFVVADIETYEWPNNIDVIFASASLLHVPKQAFAHVMQCAHQALNSRGVFYLSLKAADA